MPIKIENLNHSYKEGTPFVKQVLFDVNLRIEDGETVGLIGPTHSGKTTLAQHFNALHIPQKGRVLIDGEDISHSQTDLLSLRLRVGYVFQNPEHQLFKETVGKDVAFGPKQQGCSREEVEFRTRESMEKVGLDYQQYKDRDIFALSGGQKRRAALAGVLACRPKILVLDDVSAGLDPRGRDHIMEVIAGLQQKENLTVIYISSSMDQVARITQRLIVMESGRIVMDGSTGEIFSKAERLRALGLEPPQITTIMHLLKEKGWEVPVDVLYAEEALTVIAAVLNDAENAEVNKSWS